MLNISQANQVINHYKAHIGPGNDTLLHHLKDDDLQFAEGLLTHDIIKMDINRHSTFGTPLFYALRRPNSGKISLFLLQSGADPLCTNEYIGSIFHNIQHDCHIETIIYALKKYPLLYKYIILPSKCLAYGFRQSVLPINICGIYNTPIIASLYVSLGSPWQYTSLIPSSRHVTSLLPQISDDDVDHNGAVTMANMASNDKDDDLMPSYTCYSHLILPLSYYYPVCNTTQHTDTDSSIIPVISSEFQSQNKSYLADTKHPMNLSSNNTIYQPQTEITMMLPDQNKQKWYVNPQSYHHQWFNVTYSALSMYPTHYLNIIASLPPYYRPWQAPAHTDICSISQQLIPLSSSTPTTTPQTRWITPLSRLINFFHANPAVVSAHISLMIDTGFDIAAPIDPISGYNILHMARSIEEIRSLYSVIIRSCGHNQELASNILSRLVQAVYTIPDISPGTTHTSSNPYPPSPLPPRPLHHQHLPLPSSSSSSSSSSTTPPLSPQSSTITLSTHLEWYSLNTTDICSILRPYGLPVDTCHPLELYLPRQPICQHSICPNHHCILSDLHLSDFCHDRAASPDLLYYIYNDNTQYKKPRIKKRISHTLQRPDIYSITGDTHTDIADSYSQYDDSELVYDSSPQYILNILTSHLEYIDVQSMSKDDIDIIKDNIISCFYIKNIDYNKQFSMPGSYLFPSPIPQILSSLSQQTRRIGSFHPHPFNIRPVFHHSKSLTQYEAAEKRHEQQQTKQRLQDHYTQWMDYQASLSHTSSNQLDDSYNNVYRAHSFDALHDPDMSTFYQHGTDMLPHYGEGEYEQYIQPFPVSPGQESENSLTYDKNQYSSDDDNRNIKKGAMMVPLCHIFSSSSTLSKQAPSSSSTGSNITAQKSNLTAQQLASLKNSSSRHMGHRRCKTQLSSSSSSSSLSSARHPQNKNKNKKNISYNTISIDISTAMSSMSRTNPLQSYSGTSTKSIDSPCEHSSISPHINDNTMISSQHPQGNNTMKTVDITTSIIHNSNIVAQKTALSPSSSSSSSSLVLLVPSQSFDIHSSRTPTSPTLPQSPHKCDTQHPSDQHNADKQNSQNLTKQFAGMYRRTSLPTLSTPLSPVQAPPLLQQSKDTASSLVMHHHHNHHHQSNTSIKQILEPTISRIDCPGLRSIVFSRHPSSSSSINPSTSAPTANLTLQVSPESLISRRSISQSKSSLCSLQQTPTALSSHSVVLRRRASRASIVLSSTSISTASATSTTPSQANASCPFPQVVLDPMTGLVVPSPQTSHTATTIRSHSIKSRNTQPSSDESHSEATTLHAAPITPITPINNTLSIGFISPTSTSAAAGVCFSTASGCSLSPSSTSYPSSINALVSIIPPPCKHGSGCNCIQSPQNPYSTHMRNTISPSPIVSTPDPSLSINHSAHSQISRHQSSSRDRLYPSPVLPTQQYRHPLQPVGDYRTPYVFEGYETDDMILPDPDDVAEASAFPSLSISGDLEVLPHLHCDWYRKTDPNKPNKRK